MAGTEFSSTKTEVKETWRNEAGQTVKLIQVWGKSAYEAGSRSHQGYILEVDGEKVAYTGATRIGRKWGGTKVSSSESSGNLISWSKDSYGDEGILLSESEYKSKKESLEAEAKMKEATRIAQIEGREAIEHSSKLVELEASKAASTQTKALTDALLSSNLTPEELTNITSTAIEDTASISTGIDAQKKAGISKLIQNIGQLNLAAVTTGENVEQNLNKLATTVQQGKDQLINNLQAAKLQAEQGGGPMAFLGDIFGSFVKGGAQQAGGAFFGGDAWKKILAKIGSLGV